MKNILYYQQTELLVKILPIIYRQKDFALKGGTAINFFFHNLPRLSVDIDLVYLPIEDRDTTISNISKHLVGIEASILKVIPNSEVIKHQKNEMLTKLTVKTPGATVKIEPNFTIRGTVFPVIDKKLSSKAATLFSANVKCQCLCREDLFGGKICAALDRQHPRDLFDIRMLLESVGITEDIKNAFMFYLLSHNRPIAELLNPNLKDIGDTFTKEFSGMTSTDISLDELLDTRKQLIKQINTILNDTDRKFLLSFKSGSPDWELYFKPEIKDYPSIQWKLRNIQKMDREKHASTYKKLERLLTK